MEATPPKERMDYSGLPATCKRLWGTSLLLWSSPGTHRNLAWDLQQLNILIPPDAPTGSNVPIQLVINGVSTQSGVTIAVH